MPQTSADKSARSVDIERVLTETVIDPETYGRLIGLGRGATYRALNAGVPVEPIRIGKAFRIPTPPLRKLLHLEAPTAA